MYETIEKIHQFAKERHIPVFQDIQENKIPVGGTSKARFTQKKIYLKLHRNGRQFYLGFFDSMGYSTTNKSLFTALYLVTDKSINNVEVTKREWIDKFKLSKRYKTGNEFIDKKVMISQKPTLPITRTLVDDFLGLQKKFLSARFEMEQTNEHFIKELQGKNTLNVKLIEWLTEPKDLENFLERSCRMLTSFDR